MSLRHKPSKVKDVYRIGNYKFYNPAHVETERNITGTHYAQKLNFFISYFKQ